MTTKILKRLSLSTTMLFLLGGFYVGYPLYYNYESTSLFILSIYIGLFIAINLVLLIALLIHAYRDQGNRKSVIKTVAFMLLNVPLLCFYIFILTESLPGIIRITFINTTEKETRSIDIFDCNLVTQHINKLESGESKTVWVHQTMDCTISIKYNIEDQEKEEIVCSHGCIQANDPMLKETIYRIETTEK